MDAMSAKPAIVTVALIILLAGAVGAADTDEQFKLSRRGWTVVGPVRSVAEIIGDTDGQPAFIITPQSAAGAWAVSEPLPATTGPLMLSLRAQRRSGAGELAVSLISDIPEKPEQITPLWHLDLNDDRGHRIEVGLVLPGNEPVRLAIGAVGGEGEWLVEEIELSDWTPSEYQPGPRAHLPLGNGPEPLPVGWEPEDSLDGRWRRVGIGKEIVTVVNGLRVSLPAEVTVEQGVRGAGAAFVTNRGTREKELTFSLQGPPGAYMPTFTAPFAAGGTTRFRLPLQMLVTGKDWLKLILSSGTETAAIPLLVNCEQRFPAIGLRADWDALTATTFPRGTLLQFLYARLPEDLPTGDYLGPVLSRNPGQTVLALPLLRDLSAVMADSDSEQASRVMSLVGLYLPETLRDAAGSEIAVAVAAAASQIRTRFSEAKFISPPLPVITTDEGLQPSEQLAEALAAGMGAVVGAVAGRRPRPPAGGVLDEEVDGRLRGELCSFWADQDKQHDFQPLRQALNARGAHLPMLLSELPTTVTGDARLDALIIGRLLISGFAQGCTGATFLPDLLELPTPPSAEDSPAEYPVRIALRELNRELAGATPLLGLARTEGFSGRIDEPIVYRSFLRGREGLVFMWNNTSVPLDVAVVLQALPVQMQVLRLAYTGQFVTRRCQGLFAFSEEARQNRHQAVYVRVRPLEIVGLSLHLKSDHAGWLGEISPRPPRRRGPGPQWPRRTDQPWGVGKLGPG